MQSILKSAFVMSIATFFSRIAGLVREQVFAYFFGAGMWADAFNVAFRIPNLLRDLFAEGAMSSAFVPVFNDVYVKKGKDEAFKVASMTMNALFLITLIIIIIGIILSNEIVILLAKEFKNYSLEKFNVTVIMTQIMFPFLTFISLAAVTMGILNSFGYFFVPAIAPVFLNLAMIVSNFTLCPLLEKFGFKSIIGIAIGTLFGGVLQWLVQFFYLLKLGYKHSFIINFYNEYMIKILKLLLPGTIGLAATQLNIVINTILATSQGNGAVSWLYYAFRLMQLPLGLFGVSIAQATLPTFSKAYSENKPSVMSKTVENSIKLTAFINIISASILISLSEPIIKLLFEYGNFTSLDTINTAKALSAYSLGLIGYSGVKVVAPLFYVFGKTKIPITISILSVVLNIILNLILIKPFSFVGLALSSAVSSFFNLGFLLYKIKVYIPNFELLDVLVTVHKILITAIVNGYSCLYIYKSLESLDLLSFTGRVVVYKKLILLVNLSITVLISTIIIFLFATILSIKEMDNVKDRILKKLFNKN